MFCRIFQRKIYPKFDSAVNIIENQKPEKYAEKPRKNSKIVCVVDATTDTTTYMKCLFHDFRGPLNNIMMATDVLEDSKNFDQENKEVVKHIKDSCDFMTTSLDGFLLFKNNSKDLDKMTLKQKPFNIIGMIKKVQNIMIYKLKEKKINFTFAHEENINQWVIGDEHNLQHAVMNILSNAIKFSKFNKNIRVLLKMTSPNPVSVSVSNQNSLINLNLDSNPNSNPNLVPVPVPVSNQIQYIIDIEDENDYIPRQIKDKLFKKFETSDHSTGSGLGLFIVKTIIELHNGTVEHFYNKSIGNTFKIVVPLKACYDNLNINISNKEIIADDAKISQYMNPSSRKISISGNVSVTDISKSKNIYNIFIVDDSEISSKMLSKLITKNCEIIKKPCKLFYAIDGVNAIIKMHKHLDSIDIVFLDNVMPNLCGPLTAKILRALKYSNLIIGITGNSLAEDVKEFYENGVNYVFIKPFCKESLKSVFEFTEKYGCKTNEHKIMECKNGVLEWV
jgi:signal transduction histidine kinase